MKKTVTHVHMNKWPLWYQTSFSIMFSNFYQAV